MESYVSYIIALLTIIIAIVVIKKVAGCIIKAIAFALAIAILLFLYFTYMR